MRLLPILALPTVILTACASVHPTPGLRLERQGNEIMVGGQLFRAGTKVVLWIDPGGHNAYGSGHFEPRPGDPQGRGALRSIVTQVILHYDVAGTSKRCFEVLEKRRLSAHFLLDLDGTVYQTLDLKERAWHAGKANDRSVGIEIANIGAYPDMKVLDEWYTRDASGTRVALPKGVDARPARDAVVTGKIHGGTLYQYDFTNAQYEALGKLLAALTRVFPNIPPTTPPERTVLADPDRPGFVAHYHLTRRKVDPGPAFDWARVMYDVGVARR